MNNTDRDRLIYLYSERAKINKEVDALTRSSTGRTYAKLVEEMLYDYIRQAYPDKFGYQRAQIYEKIRLEFGKAANVKSKSLVKSEFAYCIKFLKDNYGYQVSQYYIDILNQS